MKSTIEIRKTSITDLDVDAIVNAANEQLAAGTGVCGAIFSAAGYSELQRACNAIGHCDTGDAVITPGFNSKAKCIIHAVGPIWHGGTRGEKELLKRTYKKSLGLAVDNKCRSIGFPLISSGVFGYPEQAAWDDAINACNEFITDNPDVSIHIVFAVISDSTLANGVKTLNAAKNEKCDDRVDKLKIGERSFDAVFFHKPEEPYGYLSNWYISAFTAGGIRFTSTEQFIMYKKCMIFGDERSGKAVLKTNDPAEQQDIGRKAKGYIHTVWSGIRQTIAYEGLLEKFRQNDELRQNLLDTGDAYLVECAGSDKTWACGIKLDDDRRFDASLWDGQNILGFTLMQVRGTLSH